MGEVTRDMHGAQTLRKMSTAFGLRDYVFKDLSDVFRLQDHVYKELSAAFRLRDYVYKVLSAAAWGRGFGPLDQSEGCLLNSLEAILLKR